MVSKIINETLESGKILFMMIALDQKQELIYQVGQDDKICFTVASLNTSIISLEYKEKALVLGLLVLKICLTVV